MQRINTEGGTDVSDLKYMALKRLLKSRGVEDSMVDAKPGVPSLVLLGVRSGALTREEAKEAERTEKSDKEEADVRKVERKFVAASEAPPKVPEPFTVRIQPDEGPEQLVDVVPEDDVEEVASSVCNGPGVVTFAGERITGTFKANGLEESCRLTFFKARGSFTDDTLRDAVKKWCDESTHEEALSEFGDIGDWDVSRVTNMKELFLYQVKFNDDLSGWDVSSVTDMKYMLSGAEAFDQSLDMWDVSSVTIMAYMFSGAKAFNQSLAGWDVSSVTTMQAMFWNAVAFNQSLAEWDTSSVDLMVDMFQYAKAFKYKKPRGAPGCRYY